MNQIRKDDFTEGDGFMKAIRLTTNHDDFIIDTPEARAVLEPTLKRLANEKEGNSKSV
jgi:hypothetical protein